MAWRAARTLTWGPDGKTYERGDVVPVDVEDKHLWWVLRAATHVVPESVEDLPPGASPFQFDPVVQAANRSIDRFLATKAASKPATKAEPDKGDDEGGDKKPEPKVETKHAPAKKATKATTKKAGS